MTTGAPTTFASAACIRLPVTPAFADSQIVNGVPYGTDGDESYALAYDDTDTWVRYDRRNPVVPGNYIDSPEALYSLGTLGKEDPVSPIDPATPSFVMGMALMPSTRGGRMYVNLCDLTNTEGLVGQNIGQFESDTYAPVYHAWSTGPEDGETTVLDEASMASYVDLYNAGNLGVRIQCELGFQANFIDLAFFRLWWGGDAQTVFTPEYIDAEIDADLLDTGVVFRSG